MFGIFRYLLAHIVVVSHLWPTWGDWGGTYAAFAFYVLSGYLTTRSMREVYGFAPRAVGFFLINRFLRLAPLYWCVLSISVFLLWLAPNAGHALLPAYQLPDRSTDWLANVFVLGLDGAHAVLLPTAQTLGLFLVFYVLIALGLSRYRRGVWLWLVASGIYTGYLLASGADVASRTHTLAAVALPFGVGALLAHYPLLTFRASPAHAMLAVGLFIVHCLLTSVIWTDPYGAGLYVSLALAAYAVATLRHLDSHRMPLSVQHVEHECGALSYPVFLLQWLAALLVVAIDAASPDFDNGWLFVTAVTLTDMMAWVSYHYLERHIEALRARVRLHAAEMRGQHD